MPLAATFALQWYGPACAAMVVSDAAGTAQIAARRTIAPALQVEGVGTAQLRPYRGRRAALQVEGVGTLQMRPARQLRAGLRVAVNELSQDDVTGAVLEAPVEGNLTVRQALRLMLSVLAGDATGLDGPSAAFKSLDGSKSRVTATLAAGARTVTGRDPA
jgi:hypothetical protein